MSTDDDTVFEDAMNYSFSYTTTFPNGPASINNSIGNQTVLEQTRLKKLPNNSINSTQFKTAVPRDSLLESLNESRERDRYNSVNYGNRQYEPNGDINGTSNNIKINHENLGSTIPHFTSTRSYTSTTSERTNNNNTLAYRHQVINPTNNTNAFQSNIATETKNINIDNAATSGARTIVNDTLSRVTPLSDASFRIFQTKMLLAAKNGTMGNASSDANSSASKLNNTSSNKGEPIYYRPPTSNFRDNQYGIESFLPPNIRINKNEDFSKTGSGLEQEDKNSRRIPLYVNRATENFQAMIADPKSVYQSLRDQAKDDELDDADLEDYNKNPTGEWINPIMRQALARQINKEFEIKKCLKNVLYLISFSLFRSFATKLLELYELKRRSSITYQLQHQYQKHGESDTFNLSENIYIVLFGRLVTAILILNIILSIIKLLKGQDQCKDLPLSDRQRQLIGLESTDRSIPEILKQRRKVDDLDDKMDEDAELVLKQRRYELNNNQQYKVLPKYKNLSGYSSYNINAEVSATATANDVPSQSLFAVRSANSALDANIGLNNSLVPSNLQFLNNPALQTKKMSLLLNRTSKLDEETLNKESLKFHKHFNIDFNFDDDETKA
ncbi:nuclear pore complex component-domain-containing protein [Scheffersomyces xylosifermentans]|uniref:nuclear pore complex component-domain-containing protein n=1 Tax=Scheffersomyces xylosifermentans TaxID=1304137 RepID=UPI00315D8EFE